MDLKSMLRGVMARGIFIGYSTGKPFDPTYQKRTDAIDDLVKQKTREEENEKHISEDSRFSK